MTRANRRSSMPPDAARYNRQERRRRVDHGQRGAGSGTTNDREVVLGRAPRLVLAHLPRRVRDHQLGCAEYCAGSDRGRQAVYVGVDWGGTKIEVIALTDDGRPATGVGRTPAVGLRRLSEGDRRSRGDDRGRGRGRRDTGGIGLPGSLDPRTGIAKGATSTWMNGRRAVRTICVPRLHRPVRTSNDADCFAVSEAIDGAGAGHRVVFG